MYALSFLYSLGTHFCMLCGHLSCDELKNMLFHLMNHRRSYLLIHSHSHGLIYCTAVML